MIKATNLQSDVAILKLISKAKVENDYQTENVLREFRNKEKIECPDCLFELRNGFFVGSGDHILNQNGAFFFCSVNGSRKEVDAEFIYEFCRGCAMLHS
ncbi:hypothetical protein [Pontibacillus marinus]|uniref:Uncharacterized protein n=1 Tax=Pontibacillus marinus BH030004 = DSM 16465 TaxID=1385511 RepID=A0A0A5G2Z1_9BACI|nr:hypothetical protein [Pontibacillus marinus]KGX87461.1 hypothetical protein N783_09695 [Pontibacillus marinus BH030004 = DSM 16465]